MLVFYIILLSLNVVFVFGNDAFHEELVLIPALPSSSLIASFKFNTLSESSLDGRDDYDLFPRSIGQLMNTFHVEELDVSLTRGVWRHHLWGYPPFQSAPTGAKVSAWFHKNVSEDVSEMWDGLTASLAGQLCASFQFLDSHESISPQWTYQPIGVVESDSVAQSSLFRIGILPGENVCTENITPWKKLLPCQSKRGLASLLNTASIHKSVYFSLSLSLRRICSTGFATECTATVLEFTQSLTLVFDRVFANPQSGWSLRSIFGSGLFSHCPLESNVSKIYFVGLNNMGYRFNPSAPSTIMEYASSPAVVYNVEDLVERGIYNIRVAMNSTNTMRPSFLPVPPLYSTRYIVGYGQQSGGIVTRITNRSNHSIFAVFLDVIPWYLRTYLHTLNITSDVLLAKNFVVAQDRKRPYILELVLALPANSVTHISIGFERSLLRWLEYPPDANRGFYIGSATLSALINITSQSNAFLFRIYTESLLVSLPTPDFSMPYNVICLTCTVIALAFGPLYNITSKRLVLLTQEEAAKNISIPIKIWRKLKEFFLKRNTINDEVTLANE